MPPTMRRILTSRLFWTLFGISGGLMLVSVVVLAVILSGGPLEMARPEEGQRLRGLAMTVLPVAVVVLLIAAWICADLAGRLTALTEAAEAYASGRFSVRVDLGGRDEIGRLGAALGAIGTQL